MLPDGAYLPKLEYDSSNDLTEVVFIFYASMLTMSKKRLLCVEDCMGTITSREACVDHVIGSAYQVVRYVAANMQSIIDVSGALPQLELWMPSIASVLAAMPTISNVNTNLPVIANVNSNLTMLSNVNANMAVLLNINSNVSRVMQQFDRYAVAAMESKSTSLSVGRPSVDYYSWSGVTVCPYVEVSFRYPA